MGCLHSWVNTHFLLVEVSKSSISKCGTKNPQPTQPQHTCTSIFSPKQPLMMIMKKSIPPGQFPVRDIVYNIKPKYWIVYEKNTTIIRGILACLLHIHHSWHHTTLAIVCSQVGLIVIQYPIARKNCSLWGSHYPTARCTPPMWNHTNTGSGTLWKHINLDII